MKVVLGRSKSIPRHDIPHRNRGIIAKTWKAKKMQISFTHCISEGKLLAPEPKASIIVKARKTYSQPAC